MASIFDIANQFMRDVIFLIFLLNNYFETCVKETHHDEEGEKRRSNEIVSKFRSLLSPAQGNVALSQLISLPETLSPFTTQETSRQRIGSRENVFRIRDQLRHLLYNNEEALNSPKKQSEDDTYSEMTIFLEAICILGGRREIILRIAKLEELQGPYDQPFSMDELDEKFDNSSEESFGISNGASSPRDPGDFPEEDQDEIVAASYSPSSK
jgi:hypothetical protein